MIGEQPDAFQVEVRKNLRADADFALRATLAFGQGGQSLLMMELQGELLAELFD